MRERRFLNSPWLEILVMVGVLLVTYIATGLLAVDIKRRAFHVRSNKK